MSKSYINDSKQNNEIVDELNSLDKSSRKLIDEKLSLNEAENLHFEREKFFDEMKNNV